MEIPEPRYAKAADGTALAYQVIGHGRHDIVYLPGNATQLDVMWEHPVFAGFRRRLAELGRLILMDRRGVGLSDKMAPEDLPPVEVVVSDLIAVLDTVRSKDTVLLGCDEGAMTAVLAAAAHPDRFRQLVLFGARPSMVATDRHPWGDSREGWEEWLSWAVDHWGTRESIVHDMHEAFPSQLTDDSAIAFGAKVQRAAVSPRAAVALFTISMQLNVTDVLPSVRTPTLVLHRRDDVMVPPEAGRAVAELIPGATFAELEGEDHFLDPGPNDDLFEQLRVFLRLDVSPADRSRRLATVLFTDIVDSTQRAAALGDAAWRELITRHDAIARSQVELAGGTYVKSTGDGMMATFDGPARAVRCARALSAALEHLDVSIRAGVHTGEVESVGEDLAGVGVHIAARVAALAGADEIWASSTVKDLTAGSGLTFEDAGEHELKGIPDRWRLYRVGLNAPLAQHLA